jgi:hypothetical protein
MRTKITFAAIVGLALWGSTPMAIAQTGEFAGQVPSSVIRNAWQIQDELQSARSGTPARSVEPTDHSYDEPNPMKQPRRVTTTNGTKNRE